MERTDLSDDSKQEEIEIHRLILIDYDDTLICSSYISKRMLSSSSSSSPSSSLLSNNNSTLDNDNKENLQIIDNDNTYNDDNNEYENDSDYGSNFNDDEQWNHMSILEKESINLLEEAAKHGKVIIISNAENSWIDFTLKEYFPMLAETLQKLQIEIISAREKFNHLNNNPLMWKMRSFREEISAFIHRYNIYHQQMIPKNLKFNVLSIGDGLHEKMACQNICENELKKEHLTIKLFESPTPFILIKQLNTITENFSELLSESLNYTSNDNLGRHLVLSTLENGDIYIKEEDWTANEYEYDHHKHHRKKSKKLDINNVECNDNNNCTIPTINDDNRVVQETCCSYNYWNCFK